MDLLCYRSHLDPQYMWYKHNQADFDLYTAFAKIGADALNLQGLTFDNGQFCGWPFFNPKNRGRLLQQTDGAYVQRVEKDFEDTNTMEQKYTWISAFAATYYKSISYFGDGMGSIVFQQLRESKALAYSTSATFQTPVYKNDPYLMKAIIGCQADKMEEAISGMDLLLNDLPHSEDGINNARMSLLKSFETQRFTEEKLPDFYLLLENKGITTDYRQQIYEQLRTLTYNDLKAFVD